MCPRAALIAPPSAWYTFGSAAVCAFWSASPRPSACPVVVWNMLEVASVAVYSAFMCSYTRPAPSAHAAAHAPAAMAAGMATARNSMKPETIA